MTARVLASLLVLAVAGAVLGGCIADESAPNRRGIERPSLLQGGQQGSQNAEKRALEPTQRELPTGGDDRPGQSRVDTPHDVVTLVSLSGTGEPPQPVDDTKPYITTPAHDLTVPDTGWVLESFVGEPAAMSSYPHRTWPRMAADYYSGAVRHNPVYMAPAVFQPSVVDRSPQASNWVRLGRDLEDIPYCGGQLVLLPVMMVIQPPLAQQTTTLAAVPSLYYGHTPAHGVAAPTAVPGRITWTYPFMKTQEERIKASRMPLPPLPILPGTNEDGSPAASALQP